MTFNPDLPTATPKVHAYAGGMPVYNRQTNICQSLSSSSGSDCPSAGTYSGSFDYTIPGSENSYLTKFSWGQSINVVVGFDFGDGTSNECSSTVVLNSGSYSMAAYSMAAGALVVVGLAAVGIRRRRVASIKLAREEEGTTSHFEMMPNENGATV